MDTKKLEVFQQLAIYKNFSLVSKHLYLSQPTISTHLKNLEEYLGTQLFLRKKGKVELTPSGKIYLDYVNQILTLQKNAEIGIKNYREGLSGSIDLLTTHTICNWVLPDLLIKFKKQYPKISIRMFTNFTPSIIEKLVNHEAQFGIIRTEVPFFLNPGFYSQVIENDETVLIASPKHRFSTLKKITLTQVSQESLIKYAAGTNFWVQILERFSLAGLVPNISMEINDLPAVKLMVKLGMGVSFLPSISVADEIQRGELISPIVSDVPLMKRYSILIYRKDLILDGPTEMFVNYVHKHWPDKR